MQKGESMNRFKLLFVAAISVFAFAGMATSSALASGPTLLFLPDEGPAILLTSKIAEPDNTTAGELQSENTDLISDGVLLELTLLQTAAGIEGNYSVLFLKVEEASGKRPCYTKGDKEGEVLVPLNAAEVVYWSTEAGRLQAGIVFRVDEFTIECNKGASTVRVVGSILGSINKELAGDVDEIKLAVRCREFGRPVKSEFTNSAGRVEKAHLETKVASKAREACELIGSTATLEETLVVEPGSASDMVELMF
jgi:hypothetical protein